MKLSKVWLPKLSRFLRRLDLRGLHFKVIDYGHSFTNKTDAVDHETRHKASQVEEPKVPCYSAEHFYR